MNDRQALALNHVTTGTADLDNLERYARTLTRGVRKFGTILTVDLHRKQFSWHVCVSLLNSQAVPLLIDQFSSTDKIVTIRLARELLGEVGRPDSDDIHEEDEKSVHITRLLDDRGGTTGAEGSQWWRTYRIQDH